jgi:hypothetical protein
MKTDQRAKRTDPILSHGEGHGAECADRSKAHHDIHHAEDALHQQVNQHQKRLRPLAHERQRKPEENRGKQHLQDVSLCECIHDCCGDDMQQEIRHALRLGLAGIGLN